MTDQAMETPVPPMGITKGNPDDHEVAAVVAALAAATAAAQPVEATDDRPLAGGWNSHYRTVRRQVPPGRQAWRNTYRMG